MARRGRGEGSVSKRADGRWVARLDLGRGPDGKRKRKSVYRTTRAEAAKALTELQKQGHVTASSPTLARWLDDWYATHAHTWRPGTRRGYRRCIDHWLVPALGRTRLDALTPLAVQRWLNSHGPRRIVTASHEVLRSALAHAMRQRLVSYNAAALVVVEKPTTAPRVPLTLPHAAALLTACEGHRLGALVASSLLLGLRVGEACGLAWADVDLSAGLVQVRAQIQDVRGVGVQRVALKTARSRRTLALPARLVALLTARQKAQLEERLKAGRSGADALVFTQPAGHPVTPDAARLALKQLLAAAGLPGIRFHTLRHTAATLLLADGAPLFDVSRVLGHASVDITANIYGHLVPEMTAGASARMDRLFRRG